jgi:biotin operon repressor
MSWTADRARVAALTRSRSADDPVLLNARRDLAAARLEDYITRTVAAAPPLTPAQRAHLASHSGYDTRESQPGCDMAEGRSARPRRRPVPGLRRATCMGLRSRIRDRAPAVRAMRADRRALQDAAPLRLAHPGRAAVIPHRVAPVPHRTHHSACAPHILTGRRAPPRAGGVRRVARITARWILREGIGELGLTKTEALVLLALLDHVGSDGVAWRSQANLARDLRISRQWINEAQARLRDRGLLIEHEPGRQGRATRYRFGDTRTLEPVR